MPAFRDAPSLAKAPVVRWTDDFGSLASVLKTQDFRLLWGGSGAKRDVGAGLAALGRGDLAAAEAASRRALQLDARNAEAHNGLGDLLARQGKLPEAIEHDERALAIKPSLDGARQNLKTLRDRLAKGGDAGKSP